MSNWTQEDLDAVNQAIKNLAIGARKASVTFSGGGGSRTVSYTSVDLPQLRSLRSEIISDIRAATGRSRTVLTNSRKGL